MAALLPRVVVVTRPTELTSIVAEHGTREQARFAVRDEGRNFELLIERDRLQHAAVAAVLNGLPRGWRGARIDRADLATFPFEPDDIVAAIGQDGLVANVAKYLDAQTVVGVNPDPDNYAGILVRHAPRAARALIELAVRAPEHVTIEPRTMVEARLDDGQTLRALNEIFVGQRSHQSARYRLTIDRAQERQSSSGFIVATGTGATGWARSIARERPARFALPAPTATTLALFVREAFPAPGFGTDLTAATLAGTPAIAISEMSDGGVIFGDGIEDDFLRFGWGRRVEIGPARSALRLAI